MSRQLITGKACRAWPGKSYYQTPEVRPEKVEPLKEAVEQGTYEIDARKLAKILINEVRILNP